MTLAMTTIEVKTIDSKVEQMLDWAKSRKAEAEQLSLDAVRLLSCTSDRLEKTRNQGFFKRCWSRFNGDAAAAERANTGDLIQMQKTSLRYINMLQEQQLVMAHSMLSLKNNLYSLAVKEEETRKLVGLLAQKTLEHFEKLEHRVDQLEISTTLQGWLLGLEEREYDVQIPTKYMRLFRVINDFYSIKNDAWHYNDLMFMRKAIRTVGLNPKESVSINDFIGGLTDEILQESVGFPKYQASICAYQPEGISDYSTFAIEAISSPVFVSMHGLKTQFVDRHEVVEELSDEMQIAPEDALKRLLRRSIRNMNVNLDYEFPLAETAIEILGCIRLAKNLALATLVEVPPADQKNAADQKTTEELLAEIKSKNSSQNAKKDFDTSKIAHLIDDELLKHVDACPNKIEAVALLQRELEKMWAKARGDTSVAPFLPGVHGAIMDDVGKAGGLRSYTTEKLVWQKVAERTHDAINILKCERESPDAIEKDQTRTYNYWIRNEESGSTLRTPRTGIEIFRLLPGTNCKKCGAATCLAFAMNLSSGKAELDSCPDISAKSRGKITVLVYFQRRRSQITAQ